MLSMTFRGLRRLILANGNGNNIWQKAAAAIFGILLVVILAWCGYIWGGVTANAQTQMVHNASNALVHNSAVSAHEMNAAEENIRALHAQLAHLTIALRRIDKNTGGTGEIPSPRSLVH